MILIFFNLSMKRKLIFHEKNHLKWIYRWMIKYLQCLIWHMINYLRVMTCLRIFSPKIFMLCEKLTASSRIWPCVAISISYFLELLSYLILFIKSFLVFKNYFFLSFCFLLSSFSLCSFFSFLFIFLFFFLSTNYYKSQRIWVGFFV